MQFMRKEEFYYTSRDNITQIHAVSWIPETDKPACIVQIVHGMAEHIERYDDFARFLNEYNILVTGEDHLGHGKSMREDKNPGYFCEQDAATVVVRDVHRLKKITQEKYPGVPYIILGHSMGSFILRNYICRYGSGIDGAILSGTGRIPGVVLFVSKIVAGIQRIFMGDNHISMFINKCAFGSYNKAIENPRTSKDWLTKDEAIVDAYLVDSGCGFVFTVNGFATLFELIKRAQDKNNLKKIPSQLPVYIISGEMDPVGDYGKGVKNIYDLYNDMGMTNVQMKLYPHDRHEILNETDKEQVYQDVLGWIQNIIAH